MKATAEILALGQILALCRGHDEALGDALSDLSRRELDVRTLAHPGKEDRRLLDQFAYRYTRLQDDMGARWKTTWPGSGKFLNGWRGLVRSPLPGPLPGGGGPVVRPTHCQRRCFHLYLNHYPI